MKYFRLEDMSNGWFVGAFSPTAFFTKDCEVAVKHYGAGDYEGPHHHKIATEITLVLSGQVKMMGRTWREGDIIVLDPGTETDFEAMTDAVNLVVKIPGALDDKYTGGV